METSDQRMLFHMCEKSAERTGHRVNLAATGGAVGDPMLHAKIAHVAERHRRAGRVFCLHQLTAHIMKSTTATVTTAKAIEKIA